MKYKHLNIPNPQVKSHEYSLNKAKSDIFFINYQVDYCNDSVCENTFGMPCNKCLFSHLNIEQFIDWLTIKEREKKLKRIV